MGTWKGEGAPDEALPLDKTSLEPADSIPEVTEADRSPHLLDGVRYFYQAARYSLLGGLAADIDTARRLGPDEEPERFGRREFLRRAKSATEKVGAVALVAQYGGMAAIMRNDFGKIKAIEDERWPYKKSNLTFLNNETYHDQEEVTFYLPGFGDMTSGPEAEQWQNIGNTKNQLTAFFDYGHQGMSVDELVELAVQKIDRNKVKSINIVGRSIGGLFGLLFAAKLGIPVKSITFIASPSKLSNGEFGKLGWALGWLPQDRALATAVKFGIGMYHDIEHHGVHLIDNSLRAWEDGTIGGEDPDGLQEEARAAKDIDIFDADFLSLLGEVIIPGFTMASYTATDNPPTDTIVRVVDSANDIQKMFGLLGTSCSIFNVPYDGHANVPVTATFLHKIRWTQAATSPTRVLASK